MNRELPAPTLYDVLRYGPTSVYTMASLYVDARRNELRKVLDKNWQDSPEYPDGDRRTRLVVEGVLGGLHPTAQIAFWSHVGFLEPRLNIEVRTMLSHLIGKP